MTSAAPRTRGGFRDLPIRRKLTALMLLSSAVGLLFSAAALIGFAWSTSRAAAVRDLESATRIVADNSTAALAFRDTGAAQEILSALRAKPEIEAACLYAAGDAAPFAAYGAQAADCPAQPGAPGLEQRLQWLTVTRAVELRGDRIGMLVVRQNLQPLQDALSVQIGITLAILGASFFVSLLMAWLMQPALAGPVLGLAGVARRISETRDYALRAQKYGEDEVGRLVDDFNLMLEQIGLRDQELEGARDELALQVREKSRANQELEEALDRLKQTQVQLVQSERLASLGGLVAGVAHEINTPVGVGVTAASTLQDRAAQMRKLYEADALKRSDLERFVAVADESTQIILKNLQRAADLIHSFKQVAVDQSSGERRRFGLRAYIDEVLLSLAPRLKKSGHGVQVECPADLEVDSFPGAIAQILTNLVSNSLLHGYPSGVKGMLSIAVDDERDWITLRYADDGCGIPPEHLSRIYDPFFTTKRGAGGSGLGLHIVFNLVTQMLGGTIDAHSEPGQGARFTIRFPSRARRAAAA